MSRYEPNSAPGGQTPASSLGSLRTVAQNFFALGLGEIVARVVAFGAILYVARTVGAAGYGVIAFVAGVTLYLQKAADFAIETIGTDEIARRRDEIETFGSAVLTTRIVLALVLMLCAMGIVRVFVPEPDRTVFTIYLFTLIPIAFSTKWIFLGLESAGPIGLWRVLGEGLAFALILTFVQNEMHLWRVPAAIMVGDSIVAGALLWLLFRRGFRMRFRWDPRAAFPIFVRAAPLMLQFVAGQFIYNADVIVLRLMRTAEIVGLYAAAYALISFLANVFSMYGLSLLPTLARLDRGRDEERELYHSATAHVVAVALPVAVGVTFVAPGVIQLGFGDEYRPSGPLLQVLAWCIVPLVVRVVPWSALIAHGHQVLVLKAMIYAVVLNAVLNVVLIHLYGAMGAAIATVSTETLLAALTFWFARRAGLPFVPARRIVKPVLATGLMGAILFSLSGASVFVLVPAGLATYALVLLAVGGLIFRRGVPELVI